MSQFKVVISIVAIVLTFVGYAPYIRDIFKGKTKPHVFSWFVWAIVTGIIFALQISAGAGLGAWVTLSVAVLSFAIFLLGLKDGNKIIKAIDVVFLAVALAAIPLWLVVKQPVLSAILLSAIDMLAFAPTIRKAWGEPYSETLSLYVITFFRHGLSIAALAEYNIVTWLFPATWVLANGFFAMMLVIRRRQIKRKS